MPESRYFIVTQTREVRVRASTLVDAARIAEAYLGDTPKPDLEGSVNSSVRETNLTIQDDGVRGVR